MCSSSYPCLSLRHATAYLFLCILLCPPSLPLSFSFPSPHPIPPSASTTTTKLGQGRLSGPPSTASKAHKVNNSKHLYTFLSFSSFSTLFTQLATTTTTTLTLSFPPSADSLFPQHSHPLRCHQHLRSTHHSVVFVIAVGLTPFVYFFYLHGVGVSPLASNKQPMH